MTDYEADDKETDTAGEGLEPFVPDLLWHLLGAAASLVFIALVSGWAQAGEDLEFVRMLMLGLTFLTVYLFVNAACDVISICAS